MSHATVLRALTEAPVEVIGRFAAASNVTLLCRLDTATGQMLAVYKPEAGERPLWDFTPGTLHRREVAAFVVDRALGWGMVPPTVLRENAPHGPGSLQVFIEHDPARHYFRLLEEGDPAIREQLVRMTAYDLVVNNTDRKGGHVLVDVDGQVWLVDHGVCFHEEDKLRTVAWDFAGESISADARADVGRLAARLEDATSGVRAELEKLLTGTEVAALARRAQRLATAAKLPAPNGARPFPWPPI